MVHCLLDNIMHDMQWLDDFTEFPAHEAWHSGSRYSHGKLGLAWALQQAAIVR